MPYKGKYVGRHCRFQIRQGQGQQVRTTKTKDTCGQDEDGEAEELSENIISFGTGSLDAWDSTVDSQELEDTVIHQKPKVDLEKEARLEIVQEGMTVNKDRWFFKRSQVPSVQLLTDTFLENWSLQDKKCELILKQYPTITRWTQAIRTCEVQIMLPITVVAIQCLKQIECLEPLKNRIVSLCKAIRLNNPGGRIFLATNIPNPRAAPVLGTRAKQHNDLLLRAVAIANKGMGRIFLCDVASHLWSNGTHLTPVNQHFTPEGSLTAVGCFIYRGALFREIGIVPYHMDYQGSDAR